MPKYNKLKGRIVEKYGSQGKFAEAVGLSPQQLSHKLTGRTGLSQRDMIKFAELLSIEKDEFGFYFFT